MSLKWILEQLGLVPPPRHYGSAGWLEPDNDLVQNKKGRNLDPGEIFLGLHGRSTVVLPHNEAARHGVIVGGSGSGKSRGFLIPNAAFTAGKSSLVCTDPKSELWKFTSRLHPVSRRFAPGEPAESECFNWIPLCTNARLSELCARVIVESGNTNSTEQAWLDMEASFLSGLFSLAATLSEPTPASAYALFTRQPIEALIEQMQQSDSHVAREQAMVFLQTQERMRGSIVPVVAAKLQFLRDPNVERFTSARLAAPDFLSLRKTPTAVYWCLKEQDIARLRPLTSLFFTLLLEQLASGQSDGSGVPVVMLLDEFANIGTIPHFETTISLARGRGVSLWLGIQSLSQLESRYGKPNSQTILANCATKIALSGLDVESAEYFSRSLGDQTSVVSKKSRHGILSPTFSYSTNEHARRLLTADEVRRIDANKAIAIVSNRRPMLITKHFYNEPASTQKAIQPLGQTRCVTISTLTRSKPEPPPVPDLLTPGTRKRRAGAKPGQRRRNFAEH